MTDKIVRDFIKAIIKEEKSAADLVSLVFRLRVKTAGENQPQVADIMTNIRVIQGVAIVRQNTAMLKIKGGRDVLQLEIKYMPESNKLEEIIETLAKAIKKVPGVDIVMALSVGGRDVRREDGSPFLY